MMDDVIRPQPFPDEWVVGYAGRVARLNGWGAEKELYDGLRNASGKIGQSMLELTAVHILANAAGMHVERFARDHTLLPIWRGVTRRQSGPIVPTENPSRALWGWGLRPLRSYAYFCAACAREDVDFHGQSYWRRDHQIPGRQVCAKHGRSLTKVDLRHLIAHSPVGCMTKDDVVTSDFDQLDQATPHLDRFLDICNHLLANPRARDEADVSRCAAAFAKEQGYHTGRGAIRKPLISDYLLEVFGRDFIGEAFPGMPDKETGEHLSSIDECLKGKRSGKRTLAYVAVAAILFEESDSAFEKVFESVPTQSRRRRGSSKQPAITMDQLRSSYLASHGSHQLVGLQFGVEDHKVRSKLEAVGLPAMGRSSPEQIALVVHLLLEGDRSIKEICQKLKMPDKRVRRMLEVALYPFREALNIFQHPSEAADTTSILSGSGRPTVQNQKRSGAVDQNSDQKLVSIVIRSS